MKTVNFSESIAGSTSDLKVFKSRQLIEALLEELLVWHCRPGGSLGGSVDRIFFFLHYKKSWKFLLQICLKCKLNCMQNSPMIYSDTTVFLRIACSNTKHLLSAILSNKTYDLREDWTCPNELPL